MMAWFQVHHYTAQKMGCKAESKFCNRKALSGHRRPKRAVVGLEGETYLKAFEIGSVIPLRPASCLTASAIML